MRLWTLHPRHLDSRGLVALWRESLLARAILRGETRGYRHHPQLHRFKAHAAPRSAINAYLDAIYAEAQSRGYSFDPAKLGPVRSRTPIRVTSGQVEYEWRHLLAKLKSRSPRDYEAWRRARRPRLHPMFRVVPGPVEEWERTR